jgi:hypothetical protein
MQDGTNPITENLSREVERIGSLLRSMSIQIEAIRARVSDLERWGPLSHGPVIAAGKEDIGKGGKGGKGKEGNGGKGDGGKHDFGRPNGDGNGDDKFKGKRGKG